MFRQSPRELLAGSDLLDDIIQRLGEPWGVAIVDACFQRIGQRYACIHHDGQLCREVDHVIRLEGQEKLAQSYAYKIYVASPKPVKYDDDLLELLIHHIIHIQQFEKLGGTLEAFGSRYFREYSNAGQNYRLNIMEQEAEFYTNVYMGK